MRNAECGGIRARRSEFRMRIIRFSEMPLTKADVERVAALARLELTDNEKELFARQLAEILAYAEEVQRVDTSGVPPTSHVLARDPALRDDEPRTCLPRPDALSNAPDPSPDGAFFRVPRVIG